jgi:hypothetical protein
MLKKLLLPHQGLFLQAPFLFPDRRFHLLVAGYGAGKTSSDAQLVEYLASILQGKKDREGHRPRLLLGGVTLGHLEKTTLGYILQDLENSKTTYKYDAKRNVLQIGDVDVILTPMQNPGEIMGYDVWAAVLDEVDDLGLSTAEDTTFEAVKAVNERTRQIIPGMRRPFMSMGCFQAGTEVQTEHGYQRIETIVPGTFVMTRVGYRRVIRQWQTGVREIVTLHGVGLTPEHPVWDETKQNYIEARYIDSSSMGIVSSYEEVEKWRNLLLSVEQALGTIRSILMEYDTTGRIRKQRDKDIIEVTQVMRQVKGYMSRYMKASTENAKTDSSYITSTVTQVIIALKILCASNTKNTMSITEAIGILSIFAKSVENVNTPAHQTQCCAKSANMKNKSSEVENEQDRSTQVYIEESGKNRLGNTSAASAEKYLCQEKKTPIGAMSVLDYVSTNKQETTPEKNQSVVEEECTLVCARYVEKSTPQKDRQYFAHRSALTKQGLSEQLKQLPPQSVKKLACVEECSAYAEGIKATNARSVPVYDIEVEDYHEFFVKTEIGDVLVHNSTSQGQKGLYRLYTQFKKAGTGFTLIRGRTVDNWYLDKEYVRSLYDIYNEIERKVYLEGEFLAISKGQVFGDWDWNRNYIDENMDRSVGPNETLYWGQDFNQGYHRGCVAVLRQGVVYIVKRYEFPEIRDAPRVIRYDYPSQKIFWIPDTTAKEEITHFVRELKHHNIRLVMRGKNPLVEDTAFLVNKMLYTSRLMVAKSARETAEALSLAQRDKNGLIPKGVGPRSPIHDCLVGSTRILTSTSEKRIDRIQPGEFVLTRKGWRRVLISACKGYLPVKNYAGIQATSEHPFWTEKEGMKACGLLTETDSLSIVSKEESRRWILYRYQECLVLKLRELFSTESSTIDTRKRITAMEGTLHRQKEKDFISRFGSILSGLFLKVCTFTTRIMTRQIIGLQILNALVNMSTCLESTTKRQGKQPERISRKQSRQLRCGTVVMQVYNGTENMEKRLWRTGLLRNLFAIVAEEVLKAKDLTLGSVQDAVKIESITMMEAGQRNEHARYVRFPGKWIDTVRQNIARLLARQRLGEEKVYDLSVEGEHEFFANGVLVSNCDSVRLICFFLACNRRELSDMRRVALDRHLDMMEEDKSITELNQGFYEVAPNAF